MTRPSPGRGWQWPLGTAVTGGDTSDWDNVCLWKKGNQSFLVRDDDKLVRGQVEGDVVYELYDLALDPLEERNLIDEPSRLEIINTLRDELDVWHEAQDDKGRLRVAAG